MSPTIVLITGANRGLGKGLLQRYLALPNHIVIAGNRDPAHPTSKALSGLPTAEGSRLIVVKIDACVEEDAHAAVKELRESHGIEHLDVVIANAGVCYIWPSVAEVKISDLHAHMQPNVYGVVTLFQATRPMLKKSEKKPMFVPMGSTAGLIENSDVQNRNQLPMHNSAYGPSKATLNWFGVRINAEEDWLNAWIMGPGWVQTDLGNTGAHAFGFKEAPVTLDDSCDGMMKVFGTSTKEKHGGRLVTYEGEISGW
ncbi:aflatoxin biosynthesis ketoreductase nor-1 [Colletotrichum musicola]|uniref:Aflatoxin biosynthesis ketoreductase nor-1 n=1 Tax=Colletotrichum musicola TaxID=2175873 RepID=A0A8H6NWI9_9PEZI|nr:aflatoxin biosynthesis ketoreductase nor-1 [Colletotrichum musicola]